LGEEKDLLPLFGIGGISSKPKYKNYAIVTCMDLRVRKRCFSREGKLSHKPLGEAASVLTNCIPWGVVDLQVKAIAFAGKELPRCSDRRLSVAVSCLI
jgi:hypothetical protein